MNFVPLHLHDLHSLLDSVAKPDKVAVKCQSLGYTACAVTNHGNVSSAVKFLKACKKVNIKPIIGIECYITNDKASVKTKDNLVTHQVILAKNYNGWKKLIKLVSKSNLDENFYYKPRIDVDMLKEADPQGDWVSFSGHPGSTLELNYTEQYVQLMKDIFGQENFFIEIQRIYGQDLPFCLSVSNRMRELATTTKTKTIATADSHYVNNEDAILQRITLCSSLKLTMKEVQNKIKNGEEVGLSGFFKSDKFHIPSIQELIECGNTEEEIQNTQLIADMCESYDITGPPRLPQFTWTYGLSELEYLRRMCEKGMEYHKFKGNNTYEERLNEELRVIDKASLAGYFLIVQDYVNWAKSKGWLVGVGRGSAGGCLVSYLINITGLNPIKYSLLFSRFFNEGRKGSYPDIDMDFPASKRDEVINYIKAKYGDNKVSQIATYGRMMGKGAIKEVLRNNNVCNAETMNEITENIPQESEISDLLEEDKEDSILRWTLKNEPAILQDWCKLDENGALIGEYAAHFMHAIELEGVLRSSGKHAAGVIISSDNIGELCPMMRDKNNEQIAAMDMKDLEAMGLVKFDILGLSTLDKLQSVNNLLMKGTIC